MALDHQYQVQNAVQQRDFRQDFSLRDYRVATGHATLYWNTGWSDVLATLSAGRYLAKDAGGTEQLSRVFKNGVTVGAFCSKTNVSSAQFGEGSFDKGVFVSIPFDAFLTRSSNTIANFVWKPLTRDGGAKLGRSAQLYDLTGPRSDRTLRFESAPPPNHATIPADRRDAWSPPATGPERYLRVASKPAAEQWTREASHEDRLEEALRQEFRNIRVAYDSSQRLTLTLANDRIRPLSRAAGRAARTALRLAPLEVREIRITLAERIDPLVTYDFFDLPRLERYFNGAIGRGDLADYVAVAYINPSARQKDPLERLDDLETDVEETRLADVLVPASRSFARVRGDFSAAGRTAAGANWLQAGVTGVGLVMASAALDRRADRFAADHESNRWVKGVTRAGNALPWLALAGSAVAAFDGSDPVFSDTVAGSLFGYGIGRVFWEFSRTARKGEPRVLVHRSGVGQTQFASTLKKQWRFYRANRMLVEGQAPLVTQSYAACTYHGSATTSTITCRRERLLCSPSGTPVEVLVRASEKTGTDSEVSRRSDPVSPPLRASNAFASRHTAVAWAVAIPFALEYHAPWLYGVAALADIARVGSRLAFLRASRSSRPERRIVLSGARLWLRTTFPSPGRRREHRGLESKGFRVIRVLPVRSREFFVALW